MENPQTDKKQLMILSLKGEKKQEVFLQVNVFALLRTCLPLHAGCTFPEQTTSIIAINNTKITPTSAKKLRTSQKGKYFIARP
jgi:hypothetical protein